MPDAPAIHYLTAAQVLFINDRLIAETGSAGLFLRRNGYRLTAANADLEAFTLQVAQGQLTVDKMAAWFRTHSMV